MKSETKTEFKNKKKFQKKIFFTITGVKTDYNSKNTQSFFLIFFFSKSKTTTEFKNKKKFKKKYFFTTTRVKPGYNSKNTQSFFLIFFFSKSEIKTEFINKKIFFLRQPESKPVITRKILNHFF